MPATEITPSPASAPARRARLLINRNFALLWSGRAISLLGDTLFATTLVIWVYELARGLSWAPLAVSGVVLADALPMVLVGPFAGVFVDRWDKRATLLRMDAARALLIGALLIGALLPVAWGVPLPLPTSLAPGGQLPLIYRLAAIYAATGPLLLRVTPRELVGRVTSLLDPVIAVASLVGTALAGFLYSGLLRDYHASLFGVRLGPVDSIYAVAGLLVGLGGLYALVRLRGAEPRSASSALDAHEASDSDEKIT